MRFSVVFSTITMRTSVHASDCRRAKAAMQPGQHFTVTTIDANTAAEAARMYASRGDFAERGLKEPRICKCAT